MASIGATSAGNTGGGTSTGSLVTTTYAPQVGLVVGSGQTTLTIPAGANAATARVMTGTVHRNIGANATTSNTKLTSGDWEELSGAELAAYRMTRGDGIDATVDVEYRTVG